jgi:aminoglycoside phosphotransferase (APT) family kinase protein
VGTAAPDRSAAIAAWYREHRPEADDVAVRLGAPLSQGYSNQVVVAEVTLSVAGRRSTESVVVRLPPAGPPLFPDNDLAAQAAAQDLAHTGGVPVPRPLEVELDESWLGTPFLVMPLIEGRHPGEVPALTDWLAGASPDNQRRVQIGFLDAVVAVHRTPWQNGSSTELLRRSTPLVGEVAWWEDYAAWACEGAPATALCDLFAACRDRLPDTEPAASLLWGDVRLGNAVIGPESRPAALLDWEMASLGPAESDVAWFTALSEMTEHFVGTRLPGFLDRDGIAAHVEAGLGRTLQHLAFHEDLAVARAAAVGFRTKVVAALAQGAPLPDPAQDAIVAYAARRLGES